MKLVAKVKEPFNLTPRDIRDFVASLNERESYAEKILWHKHVPPALIFRQPNQKGYFEIINYANEIEMMEYLKRIIIGKKIYNETGASIIEKVVLRSENFDVPKPLMPYFAVYRTRTPIIIASNKQEMEKVDEIKDKGEKTLKEFLKDFILNSVLFLTGYYTGINPPAEYKKQILIDVSEVKFFFVPYPKKETKLYFPAVKCRVISNFLLPRFVGYRIGYGFGELLSESPT